VNSAGILRGGKCSRRRENQARGKDLVAENRDTTFGEPFPGAPCGARRAVEPLS